MSLSTLLASLSEHSAVYLASGAWHSPAVKVEVINLPKKVVTLSIGESGNLRVRPNGTVDGSGGRGPWARFTLEPVGDAGQFRLKNVGHLENHQTEMYLEASSAGFSASRRATDNGVFSFMPDAVNVSDVSDACTVPPRILTDEERATFVRDGVLILKGLIQPELVDDALRAINNQLGFGSAAWTMGDDGKEHLGVGSTPPIKNLLLASPARSVAEQLLGPLRAGAGGLISGKGLGGQVALRFPMDPHEAKTRAGKTEEMWHIDGQDKPNMSPFQLLVGVALSSQPTDECGNLHVWPGQHTTVFAATQRQRALRAQGVSGGDGVEKGLWLGQRPKLPEEACVQVKLEPGDVVLLHQKVPHRIGLNRSPHVRYQIYFRLAALGYEPDAPQTSLWDGWGGMNDAPAA